MLSKLTEKLFTKERPYDPGENTNNPESLSEEQIQRKIDRLDFLIGYDYKLLPYTEFTSLGHKQACYDTVVYGFTTYAQVKHIQEFNIPENDTTTLYVNLENKTKINISYRTTDNGIVQKEINITPNTKADKMKEYLPELNDTSSNTSLLQWLNIECSLMLDTPVNKCTLFAWIDYYDGSVKITKFLPKDFTINALQYMTEREIGILQILAKQDNQGKVKILDRKLSNKIKNLDKAYKDEEFSAEEIKKISLLMKPQGNLLSNLNITLTTFTDQRFNMDIYNKKIITVFIQKGWANYGIRGKDSNKPFLPFDYKKEKRAALFRNLSISLLLEFSYLAASYEGGVLGFKTVIPNETADSVLSAFGSINDLLGPNIGGISPSNDSDRLALLEDELEEMMKLMPEEMLWIIPFIKTANTVSFLYGGSTNSLGLIWIFNLFNLYEETSVVYYIIASLLSTAYCTYISNDYYWAFNARCLLSTFLSIADFLERWRAGKPMDNDIYRNLRIVITALDVMLLRSFLFAGGVSVILSKIFINITISPWFMFANAIIAIFSTIISVASTRVELIVKEWSKPEWAYLTSQEKTVAWEHLSLYDIFMKRETLEAVIIAAAFPLLAGYYINTPATYALAGVGVLFIYIVTMAEIRRTICKKAEQTLKNKGIDLKDRIDSSYESSLESATLNPMVANIEQTEPSDYTSLIDIEGSFSLPEIDPKKAQRQEILANVAAADLIFNALREPYANSYKFIIPIALSCFFDVIQRWFNTLGFTDVVNNVIGFIVKIKADDSQIVGTCIILGLFYIINSYYMFYGNLIYNWPTKVVELEVAKVNGYLPKHPLGKLVYCSTTWFMKGSLSTTFGDTEKNLHNNKEKLLEQQRICYKP